MKMDASKKIWTIGEIIDRSKQYLAKSQVDSPRLDAEILLCHVLGKERIQLYVHFDQPLQNEELDTYRKLILRRAKGEPVAYIIGRKSFLDFELAVSDAVLTPRPETELLVEEAAAFCKNFTAPRILDIGTGSGAIVLGILSLVAAATAVAVDISPAALQVAADNAHKLGLSSRVDFRRSDVYSALAGEKFQLIVSNPPYIPSGELEKLPREVKKEPRLALDGGADGLDCYRRIIVEAGKFLLPAGLLALEIGIGQGPAVAKLAQENGFAGIRILHDYAGIERIVLLTKEEGAYGD